ncbi:hypothetical protein [Acinetobacter sp. ANC 4178]|uniref:hypothetical protein n=1 Tax=Acinetobacter sp. ANC 4178 TaxID=2529839 RepID=UPI00103DBE01|nr:hypothetical protein [Acinetobacter sp. ANC 4178]TCB68651.1 hypothetical protein E0H87_01545 [Acinetobacter sp. ANC 4178]
MKTFLAILTILNFIFIIDLIFFNSYCIKKVRYLKKFIPNIIKKLIDSFKDLVYRKLFNEEEKKEKFNNDRFKLAKPEPSLIESAENLKIEILSYINKKPNFLLENYPPHQTIYSLKHRIENLTTNEVYLLETIKNGLIKINYDQVEDRELATHYIEIITLLESYDSIHSSYKNGMKNFYDSVWQELNSEINKFRRLNEVLKNAKTSHVYQKSERQSSLAFYIYLGLALITIVLTVLFSIFILEQKKYFKTILEIDNYDYWALKLTGIFISITLITFLIKQAVHYQKKKDQAQRIRLELDALPTYIFDLEEKDKKNIRKELIPKYFGNNSDLTTLNEIGNIVTEQLKTSSDVAKSSAEVIKALTPK